MKEEKINELIDSIRESIENSSESKTRRKVKSIINILGNQRLTQKMVDSFNESIKRNNIKCDRDLEMGMSERFIINFFSKSQPSAFKEEKRERKEKQLIIKKSETQINKLSIPDNFL
jgi:hypothetical protein